MSLTNVKLDAELLSTRDAAVYLFNGWKIAGLYPAQDHYILQIFYWLWLCIVFFFCSFYFPLSFILTLIFDKSEYKGGEFIAFMQFALSGWGFASRFVVVYIMRERLQQGYSLLDQLDRRCSNQYAFKSIRTVVTYGKLIYISYLVLYTLYTISNCSSFLFTGRPSFNLYNPVWNWRNSKKHLYAQAALEFVLVGFCTFIEQLIDCYAIIYVLSLRTHVKILINRIEELGSEIVGSTKESRYLSLVQCIQDHKIILQFCETIRPVISVTIFVQFMVCGSILGLAALNILLFANFLSAIGTAIYMCAILSQTFPLCYICDCLTEDCSKMANAVLQSEWINENKRYRTTILYFLHMAQQPIAFSAMGVFPITVATNVTFAKFAFTVYTVASKSNVINKVTNEM